MSEELLQCPLITPYTAELGIQPAMLEKLFVIRKWDIEDAANPLPFQWPSTLRRTIWDTVNDCDTGEPLILRQYQLQQIHHMVRMPMFINGDAVGLGKTVDVIAAACWLKDRYPDTKIVVLGTKSVTWQWYDEFKRFSFLKPYVMRDSYKGLSSYNARYAQMMAFLEGKNTDVMIVKYTSLLGTCKKIEGKFDDDGNPVQGREQVSQEIKNFAKIFKQHRDNIVLAYDESHKFKGQGTQIRTLAKYLSKYSGKTWALTATAIQNGLDEFYSISTACEIQPFGNMADFYDTFCVFRDQYVGNGISKPVLMGYKEVPRFRAGIRPFFLGRSQAQVKEKLPVLTTLYHPIDLDEKQVKILTDELPNGTLYLPPTLIKVAGEWCEKERDPDNLMTQMSVQQLVANHWALLDKNNEKDFHTKILSPKEECLLDMLDGDFRGEKVIVYTKYRTWIDRLEWITKNGFFTERKFLRITGAESESRRAENKRLFQTPESGYDLIVVNAAGIEGINLQQAAHLVCLDLPWSWGQLIQLVGRMVRMASPNSACTLHIIPAKGTIDEYTVETLKGKKGVFAKILGESHCAGILENTELNLDSGLESGASDDEFIELLRAHVKSTSMGDFLQGDKITDSQDNKDYKMSFEKKPGTHRKKKTFELEEW
jgi:SNF2 family DNA or RNA helicase